MTRTLTALCALAFSAVGVLTGCASDIDGSATPTPVTAESATTERTSPNSWLSTVLPTGDELSKDVGRRVRVDTLPPLLGTIDDLRDTVSGTEDTNSSCITVVSPLEKQAYADSTVRAVTYSTQSTITAGAVWLSSESDARALFTALSDRWRQCDGTSYTTSTGGLQFDHQIAEVKSTNDVVSAIVGVTSTSGGAPVRTERALGVARDCIVEAEVPVTASPDTLDQGTAATNVVATMLARVNSAQR